MNKDALYVTKDFVDYISPLIQGDYQPIMVNGLPRHLVLNLKRNDKSIYELGKNLQKFSPFFDSLTLTIYTKLYTIIMCV